ncbi:toll-like receptor 13 isoform X2 [Fopius arisanus]|uniref:Toll-like receptor 13 isoform X2 n=1 Tax=Fopius arisanus TaxID=64838 RepID=A0A9R1TZK9_9HYME|nr:PREDICTED: toll-like receptor 13 isoform X2 [Fopius arisanus]
MKEILFLIFGLVWSFNDAVSMDQVNYSKCFERNRTSFFCPDSQLHEFPENITKSIQYLDLTGNYLKIIPSDIGRFVELKYLNLGRNLLTGLPDNFKELCKLERLDLSNNDIHDITAGIGVITKLPNLRILNIKGNSITSLENLASEVVRAVDASHCSITNMTNTSLLGLPDLRSLTLAGNPLKTLQDIQSEKLKWLDLSTCRLNYLVADTFKKLPALEYLKLSHNPKLVYSTRKETLKHSSLKKLDASGCNLDRPGIHGLPSLTHVTLSHNMIHFLPDYIFVKNGALIHLNLSFNGLLRINACSLIGMPKLAHLDLSGNHLENISASAFRDNIELKSLNISHNGMRNFPRLVASVVNLDLSTNLIEYIPRDSLRNMWRIDSLILSGNRLERFETGMASRTLKTLILKENGILRLSTGSLENLPMLRNIDLSGNRLTEGFQSEVFSRNPELNSIELHNNPWHCDCNQLLPIYLYLTQSPMKRTLRTLMCHSPNDKSGYLWTTACNQYWTQSPGKRFESNRSFVIVVLGVFLAFLVFASTISIGHTVKTRRRQAELRVREAERAEARERLLLHRRRVSSLE